MVNRSLYNVRRLLTLPAVQITFANAFIHMRGMRKREIVINVSQTRRIFTILSTDVVSIYIYIQIYFIWLWQTKIQLKTNKKVGLNNATCGGSSSLSCKRTSFFECDPTTSTCQCKAPYLWDATLTSQTCSKCIDNYFASSGASCRFVFWTFLHFFFHFILFGF